MKLDARFLMRECWMAGPFQKRHGVRWQGGSRDTAFARAEIHLYPEMHRPGQSGVARCFPPHSMTPLATSSRPLTVNNRLKPTKTDLRKKHSL